MSTLFTRGHALIVGVGGDLPATSADASAIADALRDPARGAYPPEQVTLLVGHEATRRAVLSALDRLAKETPEDATVLIFLAGRAYEVSSPAGEASFLLTHGYDLRQLFRSAISGEELVRRLRAIRAREIVLLLDCCHAGGPDAPAGVQLRKLPIPTELQRLCSEHGERVLVASSKADERAHGGWPNSAFGLALLEALGGAGATQPDGYVRTVDLAMYLRKAVPSYTNDRQHPILNITQAENFVLGYYAGGALEPRPPFAPGAFEIEPEPGAWPGGVRPAPAAAAPPEAELASEGRVEAPQGGADIRGGFYEPGWKIMGNVYQAQASASAVARDLIGEERARALGKLFADAVRQIRALPPHRQEEVEPSIYLLRTQIDRIEQGDASAEAVGALERRLRGLRSAASEVGDALIERLADSAGAVAGITRDVARKLRREIDR